ncbi:MAG: response regulator [Oscillospiraceae bacterium]|nr:response regulator [Oscillospiraceae bacterium]
MNKPKVLIADDEKSTLDVLVRILKDDFSVYPAKTGGGALKKASEINPDLIILDVVMPDINGFDVLARLKADVLTAHIPVIFITALDNPADEQRGLSLGAADYIFKPFNNEVVKERVKKHIGMSLLLRAKEELGTIEPVTGFLNRKGFDQQLFVEWARSVREQKPVSLMLVAIADFDNSLDKATLMQSAAEILRRNLKRATDVVALYNQGIFAVILPNTPKSGAETLASAIKSKTHTSEIHFNIGVSTAEPKKGDEISLLVLQADRNLKDE